MGNTCERDTNANSSENVNVKMDQTRNGQEKHKNMERLCLGLWCATQKTKKCCRWGMYGVTFFSLNSSSWCSWIQFTWNKANYG